MTNKLRYIVKLVILLSLIEFTRGNTQAVAQKESDSPLTLSAHSAAKQFKLGSAVPVDIKLVNKSLSPINMRGIVGGRSSQYYGFTLLLTHEGKDVPRRPLEKTSANDETDNPSFVDDGKVFIHRINPGVTESISLDLSKVFLVSKLGLYLFSVELPKNLDHKSLIHSQVLSLKITP